MPQHHPGTAESNTPATISPFRSFIPLTEVLSEIQGVGPASKKVQQSYESLVAQLGSELFILEHAPLDEIRCAGSSLIAEAITRMRAGRVKCEAGFDGQYGAIRLFSDDELTRGMSVGLLFDLPPSASKRPPAAENASPTDKAKAEFVVQ